MATVIWTTKRNPISGHSIGNQYYIDFNLAIGSRKSYNSIRNYNDSISGKREVIRHREDVNWDITATIIPEAQLELWYEFLSSVVSGETFQFDAFGTYASPNNLQTVILLSDGWSENPMSEVNDYFEIQFQLRVY